MTWITDAPVGQRQSDGIKISIPPMDEPLQLTIEQQFEVESMSRLIETSSDPEAMRELAKKLLLAWQLIDTSSDLEAMRELAKQLLLAWQLQKASSSWLLQHRVPPTT